MSSSTSSSSAPSSTCAGRKPRSRFIDTHAGIGFYDLSGEAAGRTGEWRDGVGRLNAPLNAAADALLAPFCAVLEDVRRRHGPTVYPGSPLIARELLRRQDRGILVELHSE